MSNPFVLVLEIFLRHTFTYFLRMSMDDENLLLDNHLSLLLKMYVYNSRSAGTIVLNVFLVKLYKIEHIENCVC